MREQYGPATCKMNLFIIKRFVIVDPTSPLGLSRYIAFFFIIFMKF